MLFVCHLCVIFVNCVSFVGHYFCHMFVIFCHMFVMFFHFPQLTVLVLVTS